MKNVKNLMKKVIICTVLVISIFMVPTKAVWAADGDILGAANEFINQGKELNKNDGKDYDYFAEKLAPIGKILVQIGGTTVLIVGAIMAVKWITAKANDQAKLKTQLIGLVVSIVVIFGAYGIWRFAISIMDSVTKTV